MSTRSRESFFLTIALGADVNAVVWACSNAIYALHRTKCSTMLVHDSTASAAEDFFFWITIDKPYLIGLFS